MTMLFLAADSTTIAPINMYELLQVTGTPGTLLLLYIIWWKTVGKDKTERDNQTALALQRTSVILGEVSQNLYRLHDKTEDIHNAVAKDAETLVNRGERIVDRLDERFPSGAISPPKPIGA